MKTLGDVGAGHTLGRYELLVPIAQGGMAVVWAARLKGTRGFQKIVAVKSMLPALSDDPQFEQMFLAEAELAARIRHPHVCEILDLGEQEGVLYLVMEWVDGEPLSALHKAARPRGGVPLHVATKVTLHAALGLHAAHELKNDTGELVGLVHRDVSPQNILVTYDGVVKIVDFGVAKATEADGSHTRAGQLKGKVPFMSPEQAVGKNVDRRTDIFALGIVLYQLVTGKHPFRGDNDMATLHRITEAAPVPPASSLRPDCPPSLDMALAQALEKDVSKRFQTMHEMAKALERALAEMTAQAEGEDLATFVRSVLGDRADKRRAAIKDAIRLADARLVAKKIGDTSGAVAAGERPSMPSLVEGDGSGQAAQSGHISAVTKIETHNSHPSGATGFVVPDGARAAGAPSKGRTAMLALGLLAAGGLGAGAMLVARRPAPQAIAAPAATAAPAAPAALAPQPSASAAPDASAAPSTTVAAVAASSSASAGPTPGAATGGSGVAGTNGQGALPVPKLGGPLPRATPSSTPTAAPAAGTGAPRATPPVVKVSNPGF
jgi:serine/threonine-protein kinase